MAAEGGGCWLDVASLFGNGGNRGRGQRLGLLAFAGVAIGAVGCTEFEPGTDTLNRFDDGVGALEPTEGADWRCLAQPVQQPSAPVFAGAAPRVIYSLQMVDLSSGAIYRSIQVRACALTDVDCNNPLTDWLSVNEQGRVDVPLFQNFTGYLEIDSSLGEIVPQLFFFTEPLQPRAEPEFPLAMVAVTNLPPLVQLLGVEPQPTSGMIALRVFDCGGKTAAGVSLSTPSGAVPWYFVGGLPSGTQTETGPEGLAGFLDVPPGVAVFDAVTEDGTVLGGLQSVVIRSGYMSSMYLKPPGVQTSAP